jgi:hypothetical protein
MLFTDNTSFSNFVYDNICQCFNQCINLQEYSFKNKQPVCSEITNLYEKGNTLYDDIITNAINFFIKQDIIFKNGVKYYLTENNTKFTWDNIKNMNRISYI